MSIANRIERIFGRTPPPAPTTPPPLTPSQLPPQVNESGPFLMPMLPPPTYQQWYDSDPELFENEKQSLDDKGFPADCTTLPDARACFTVTLAGKRVALICSHQHPLKPATVQMLDDIEAPTVVDEMGQVDLFAHDNFRWSVHTSLGEVAQRVATMLSVASSKSSGPKRGSTSNKPEETGLIETVDDKVDNPPPEVGDSSAGLRRRIRPG